MNREERWSVAEEARQWAVAEGCEGGDFLEILAHAIECAHYSQDPEVASKLLKMICTEIDGLRDDERVLENYFANHP